MTLRPLSKEDEAMSIKENSIITKKIIAEKLAHLAEHLLPEQ